ncbi:MAG TPA: GcrA family cell cycle regulator [Xanthobacteraceae bacterium]|jgi:hypothetical protein|nr:GcrA family cell cycle regulator [Xanthobacteraceae bacterium]
MRGAAWNDSKIVLLKRLWAQGETANAIGKRLGGLSRAAVLGKIHRLRLGAKPLSRRRGKVAETAQPSAGTGPRTLFDLTNECCRWASIGLGGVAVLGWVVEAGIKWLVATVLSHFQ